jgi:hypothetical protein
MVLAARRFRDGARSLSKTFRFPGWAGEPDAGHAVTMLLAAVKYALGRDDDVCGG